MTVKMFRKGVANIILSIVVLATVTIAIGGDVPAVSSKQNLPVYSVRGSKGVCLMVNVYWGDEYLPQMLDIFEKNTINTTFFVGGSWAEKNEEMLKRIHDCGHEIANHGYFHKDHKKANATVNKQEIQSTHNLIKSMLGIDMSLFSPPSAAFSEITLDVAEKLGYTTIMYSKDTIDWRDQDAELIISRATKNIEGGDLVLMHPTAATVSALQKIIDKIKEKGLIITTVSDVLELSGAV